MFNIIIIAIVSCTTGILSQGDLPSYITKCNKNNYEQCVLAQQKRVIENLQYGDKTLGFPNMNPFHVESMSIKSPDLTMKMSNINVYWLNESEIRSMKYDFDKLVNNIQMYNKRLVMLGDCEMKGRISILNLEGKGYLKLVLNGVLSNLKAQYILKNDRRGFRYFSVKNATSSYTLDGMKIEIKNLFPNEDLNRQLNVLFNENWKAFNEMIHDHVIAIINQVITKAVNGFMRNVPYENVFANND